MKRADTPDGLYVVGNPVTGEKGTRTADFYNDVQEEICNVIEAAGIVLDGGQRGQLLDAISRINGSTVTRIISGSGNVLASDTSVLVDATAGPVDLVLHAANDPAAKGVTFVKIDDTENLVTVTPVAGTICRTGGIELYGQDEYIKIVPNSTDNNWYRVG